MIPYEKDGVTHWVPEHEDERNHTLAEDCCCNPQWREWLYGKHQVRVLVHNRIVLQQPRSERHNSDPVVFSPHQPPLYGIIRAKPMPRLCLSEATTKLLREQLDEVYDVHDMNKILFETSK